MLLTSTRPLRTSRATRRSTKIGSTRMLTRSHTRSHSLHLSNTSTNTDTDLAQRSTHRGGSRARHASDASVVRILAHAVPGTVVPLRRLASIPAEAHGRQRPKIKIQRAPRRTRAPSSVVRGAPRQGLNPFGAPPLQLTTAHHQKLRSHASGFGLYGGSEQKVSSSCCSSN